MRLLKHLRLTAVIVACAGLVAVAMWPERSGVEVAAVVRGSMQVTIDEDGVTRVRNRFIVSAPVAGRLQRLELEPGDSVKKGTTVARLQPADAPLLDARTRTELMAQVNAAEDAVRQATAERDRARATLDRARTLLQRQHALVAAGATARDDVDAAASTTMNAQAAVQAADAAVDRLGHDLELARARLAPALPSARAARTPRFIDVPAPCDGVVLRLVHESEALVAAGEPLLELANSADLEVVADVLSTDAVKIASGQKVLIEGWGGPESLQGEVRRVEPGGFVKLSALGIEEQRVNVVIALASGPQPALGDGYRVAVRIVVWTAGDVVKAPLSSLFRRGADWNVFVVRQGRLQLRTVRISHRNDDAAEIVSGLEPGDSVVLHPPDTLADGARVAPLQN